MRKIRRQGLRVRLNGLLDISLILSNAIQCGTLMHESAPAAQNGRSIRKNDRASNAEYLFLQILLYPSVTVGY